MTVQQHHRFPVAAVPHAERHIADIDPVQLEAVKHEPHLPHAIRREPRGLNAHWTAASLGGKSPGCALRHRPKASGSALLLAAVPLGGLVLIAVASGIL
jgi:hypothetical protein